MTRLLLLFLLCFCRLAAGQAPQKVHILRVIDGDTVVIRTGKGESDILRFVAIDTPEMKAAGGREAKAYLVKLLASSGKKPLLLTGTKRDKYRRRLGTLTLPDGRSVSQLLLSSGHARRWP